jgi:tetratricopeptide (TPR) repeat protein
MSKKKKQRPTAKRPPAVSSKEWESLDEAERLLRRRKWAEAKDLLEPFSRRHPNHLQALLMLSDVYAQAEDQMGFWDVTDRLIRLDPDTPEHWSNMATICMANGLVFSALHYATQFLERWPDDRLAGETREKKDLLQDACDQIMAEEATTPGAVPEHFMLFEESQMVLNRGDYKRGERIAREAIEKLPHAVAPRNNLTLAYGLQGQFDKAMEMARSVLERDPNNVHALGNLTQVLTRAGRREEAREVAGRMLAVPVEDGELYAKKMEALAYLGDDAMTTALYQEAQASGLMDNLHMPQFHHLGAVGYARQGDTRRAEDLWKQALKMERHFELARKNLNDLKMPVGERNGAWPYSIAQWVPQDWIETIYRATLKGKRSETALKREIQRALRQQPYLEAVIPLLLERGDPEGREFAIMLATQAELPILREFALGDRGTDQQRMKAAQEATQLGMLPRGKPVPLLIKGERQDLMLMAYEIYEAPQPARIPRQAQDLLEEAHEALSQRRGEDAERLAREALAIAPYTPTLMNFLSAALLLQGRKDESRAVTRELAERQPDYFFARTEMARICVDEGDLEQARAWLDPLLEAERFHRSEFAALCMAQAELLVAEGQRDGARSWLQMWEQVDKDNPNIRHMRRNLKLR